MIEQEKKKCIMCGREFVPKTKRSRFCSETCMRKCCYQKEREKKRSAPKKEKICVICGKVIDPKKSSKKYCSAECRKKNEQAYSEMLRNRKIEAMNVPRTCPVCGKDFLPMVWNQEACNNNACKAELKRIKARKEIPGRKKRRKKIKYGSKEFHELPFAKQWELMTLAEANDYARKQHKTYGDLQKEYYAEIEGFKKNKMH